MFAHVRQSLAESWDAFTKSNIDQFIDLECAVGENTLATNKGALVSIIQINGSRLLAGEEEAEITVDHLTSQLNGAMSNPGHALQVCFTRSPVISKAALDELMSPAFGGAKACDLALEDILQARSDNLQNFLAEEELLICCWSNLDLLNHEESRRNKEADKEKTLKWPFRALAGTQDPEAACEILIPQHESFVHTVMNALELKERGLDARLLTSKEALRQVRKNIRPDHTWPEWDPVLYGDPLPPKELSKSNPDDPYPLLWPKLSHQLCDTNCNVPSAQHIEIDNRLWAPVDMIRPPMEPRPFNELITRLHALAIPFRITFLIEGGGKMTFKKNFAYVIRFTNATNYLLKQAIDEQEKRAKEGNAIVRMRCSLATWDDHGDVEALRRKVAHLERAVQGFGRSSVTTKCGDPLEAFFSTVPAAACRATGDAAIPSLKEAITLLPLQRPAMPAERGTHLFRSKDGKPWPYRPDTGLSPLIFDIIFGNPGMGKSVLQNSMALSSLLGANSQTLPYMAILDIGRSSAGLIDMLREALPANRRHEVQHLRLINSAEMAVNPHDTQLGFRKPMPLEFSYLTGLYSLLICGPNEKPTPEMSDLIHNVVKELYRLFSDEEENTSPKKYSPNTDYSINETLLKLGYKIDAMTTWWEVVDFLFEQQETVLASKAQRYAMPILSDAPRAANSDRVSNLFRNTLYNGESIVELFNRRVNTAAGRYPVLARETCFDLGNTRVCALDLAEVTGGHSAEDKHASAIIYMFARHMLVHHWWFEDDLVRKAPENYKEWHRKRVKSLLSMPKRLCYDEFHRTGHATAVRDQLIRDARETRKMNVQLSVATQMLNDFSEEMINLASSVWILGAGTDNDQIKKAVEIFNLNDTAEDMIRNELGPPTSKGATCLNITGTGSKRYEQLLYNTLGARELWALTTTPEDVSLRAELSKRVGPERAREILSKRYPKASAKAEIEQLKLERSALGDHLRATDEAVSAELADKLETLV